MAFSGVDHVRELDQSSVSELVGMVARLRGILSTTSDVYSSVVCLDRAEPDGDVEVNVQDFLLLPLVVNVVECDYLLVELEEVDLVGLGSLHHLLLLVLLPLDHPDPSLFEVVRHR